MKFPVLTRNTRLTMPAAIKIIIVDDHQVVLNSWKELLEKNPRFEVIGLCLDGQEAINKTICLSPDIILVDVIMKPLNGFKVTEQIHEKMPEVKIIGMSVNDQPNYASKMMELGAMGYLTKTSTLEEINLAINEVYEGKSYLCEEVKKKMDART